MNLLRRLCDRGLHRWLFLQRSADSQLGAIYQCQRCGTYMGIIHPSTAALLRKELAGE